MTTILNCGTFNVGSLDDIMNFSAHYNEAIDEQTANRRYQANAQRIIPELVANLDIICLQEMIGAQHQFVQKLLISNGFIYVGDNRLGVAFLPERFTLLSAGNTYVWENKAIRPSYGVDLFDKTTQKVIRVISAHLKGFNVAAQKQWTAEAKKLTIPAQIRGLKYRKNNQTIRGDLELQQALRSIQIMHASRPAELTIIGLDANATAPSIQNSEFRVHTKRLQQLSDYGFQNDNKDQDPTISDKSDGKWRRYDYIYGMTIRNNPNFTIWSHPAFQLGAQDPKTLMSDHVPVIAKITF